MRRSRPIKLVAAFVLSASGLLLLAVAAWSTFAAYVLGSVFDMVHLENLDWLSAAEIASMAAAGLSFLYLGLKLLPAWPTGASKRGASGLS